MDTEPLLKAGLTEGEVKVYLALLRLGASTAGPIAYEARVARSKLYDILDRLAKKGLVSHAVENGVKRFSPADPSRLRDFLRTKEEDIKLQRERIEHILPRLSQEFELQGVQQDAEVFEGLEGLKIARERGLKRMKKGTAMYFLNVPASALDRMEAYYTEWNERRISKGILSYTTMPESARTHPYIKAKLGAKHTSVRFLPRGIDAYSWTEIYDDTVVLAINHGKPMSIVIRNRFIAETYKQQFQAFWKMSKP